ncbi:YidC/Oxa1 family membrane protein insertase [Treponema putidum]|uniref:Preprotein translocase YidC n=1 Tax=Treponema putidum TaxID=221027 RepID=A0ABY5HTF8_9SPIR|nr:YidC/Oxa1 family membrane protein insertase [Treponema putidum]UTY28330.1 preprotein translocase YidC [Treponema putidum]
MSIISKVLTGLLYPFVVLIQTVFSYSYSICGNYGISLILLSLFITAITAPLYYLAEQWKNKERVVQKKMNKDIKSINENYEGQKRFYLTKAARKIYDYKWWYTFRTSFGLIIQIPFFFAAYEVLSKYSGYNGISFLFIKDLGMPDNLIFGINVLPFVMTIINIAYSIYYTKSKSWNANKELYIMAGLFLVLLYNSPSALLLYWTMNNVFSFIKGIILRKAGLSDVPVIIESEARKSLKEIIKENINIVYFFFFTLLCSLQVYSLVRNSIAYKYFLFSVIGVSFIVSLIVLIFKFTRKNIYGLLFVWLLYLPFLYLLIFTLRTNAYISPDNIKLLNGFYSSFIIIFSLNRLFYYKKDTYTEKPYVRNSIPIIFFTVFWLFFYLPFLFYINNPEIIRIGVFEYLIHLLAPAAVFFCFFVLLYFLLPLYIKSRYSFLCLFVLLAVLSYSLIFKLNVGELDFFMLKNADAIFGMKLLYYILDAFILSGLLYISKLLIYKYKKAVFSFSLLLPIILSIVLLNLYKTRPIEKTRITYEAAGVELPKTAYNNYIFSKNKKNLVCVLVDMFNGNYLGKILNENPEYRQKLSGFTWYSDCLSVSISTKRSLAGLLGGHEYSLKASEMMDYNEINTEAASFFFNNIFTSGYDMSVDSSSDYSGVDMSNYHMIEQAGIFDYWKKIKGYKDDKELSESNSMILIMLSVLQSAPYHFKYIIYDDEEWLFFHKSAKLSSIRYSAMNRAAGLELIPMISSTIESDRNKCMYLHTMLPHYPYGVNKFGKIMEEAEFGNFSYSAFNNKDLALYSAKLTLDYLIDWFEWMKNAGVYDNTVIYIFADHGNTFYDSDIPKSDNITYQNAEKNLSAANSLLLIKPLDSKGELFEDRLYLSSADLHSMLVSDAGLNKINDVDPRSLSIEDKLKRTRMFFGPNVTFLKNDKYYVTGSIFDPSSWSMVSP